MRETNLYCIEKEYVLKLPVNIVTTGTEPVTVENKFCIPVSKESATYELNHVDTYQLTIVETL
jgi:hypothetical protein